MIDLRKPAKLADQRLEDSLQKDCAAFVKKALYLRGLPQLFYHPPNGGNRTTREAAKLKLHGVLSGVSDVVIPFKSGEHSGLYIELKTKNGCPSPDQRTFLKGVAEEGYLALVINDLDTFKECVTRFLDNRKTNK